MFRRISYKIALQFTALVFVLFLVNGTIFLATDFQAARRTAQSRLASTLQYVLLQPDQLLFSSNRIIPLHVRERIRIVNAEERPVFVGSALEDVPFRPDRPYDVRVIDGERYGIVTLPILRGNELHGYAQIAEVERVQLADLPFRALIYLLVSIVISAVTFGIGILFARRSLRPAEQMMQRLEQFTQDASHELRTPLATLNSSLDLALHNHQYRDGLLSAKDDVRQLATVVERLLELARLDKMILRTETIDLSGLARDAVDRHLPLGLAQGITIEGEIAPQISVQGDAALLRQVIDNLLANAVKFGKRDGGHVQVTLTKDSLSVSDDGIGIAESALPHIFDRFYQANTSRAEGGFGLGLALVRRIVELHGWTIGVRSREGEGATFIIRFYSRRKRS